MGLYIKMKEQFSAAARAKDFSAPELADLKARLDHEGLKLTPLSQGAQRQSRMYHNFIASGANDGAEVAGRIARSPAVERVELPVSHYPRSGG